MISSAEEKTPYNASSAFAGTVVPCLDFDHSDISLADLQRKKDFADNSAPFMGGLSPTYLMRMQCVGWPAPSRSRPHEVKIPRWDDQLFKIVLVTSENDPATPSSMARRVQEQIGKERSIFITRHVLASEPLFNTTSRANDLLVRAGAGHTSWFQPGRHDNDDGETQTAIDDYLLKLHYPEDGKVYDS